MPVGTKPDGTTAPRIPLGLNAIVVPGRRAPAAPAPLRTKKKPARKGNGLLYLAVAVGLALAASTAVLNHTWPKFLAFAPSPAPVVANKPDPAVQNKSGQIIIPRANTDLCDRYMFDNASGQMKQVVTTPCSSIGKKQDINIADQVNSFHSSWRGSGPATAPRGAAEAPAPNAR